MISIPLWLFILILIWPIFLFIPMVFLVIYIGILPREDTRLLRQRLADFTLWQWATSMKLVVWFNEWLRKNGKG